MAKDFDNTNRGALFKSEKRDADDRDYGGSINVDGKEFWVSAWIKTSKKGEKFMSLSVKPKEAKSQQGTTRERDADRDHPF